jgi:hypothetical protein
MRNPLTESYKFNDTDQNIVEAARLLLRKLSTPGTIRPVQLVTVRPPTQWRLAAGCRFSAGG